LRTFTDNVVNLAVEGCLVCDIPEILTPTKVDGMTNEEVEELAAETDDTKSRRDHLQAEIEILREGLEQCRKFKSRDFTGEIVKALKPNTHCSHNCLTVIASERPASSAPGPQATAAPGMFLTARIRRVNTKSTQTPQR